MMSVSQKIVMTGSTGFIGSALSLFLLQSGYEVIPVTRLDLAKGKAHLINLMEGCAGVINLAGAPVSRRWTRKSMKEIEDSRLRTTALLAEAILQTRQPPRVFVSASAVGIYPDTGAHDESSRDRAGGFLGELCIQWEAAAGIAAGVCRIATIRIGLVLGRDGGLMQKLLPVFRLGLGGELGTGNQEMPFIHIHDLVRAMVLILEKETMQGPVNLVAPHTCSNSEFTRELAKRLRRPAWMAVPSFALRMAYGKAASAFLTGQKVLPGSLTREGFVFRFPDIRSCFHDIIP